MPAIWRRWAARAAPARPAGWLRRDKAKQISAATSSRPKRAARMIEEVAGGVQHASRQFRSARSRARALWAACHQNQQQAATPAARARSCPHHAAGAGHFEEDHLRAESNACQRAQQQRGRWRGRGLGVRNLRSRCVSDEPDGEAARAPEPDAGQRGAGRPS